MMDATTWKKEIISKWDILIREGNILKIAAQNNSQLNINVEDANDDATDVSFTSAATALVSDADDSIYFTKRKGFQDKNSVA